jgi:triacylglycerol esterase/lipase EstA (alpha/beta hydrolase family)
MLSRLQRAWVLSLMLFGGAAAWWALQRGTTVWTAVALAVGILNLHAAVLAFEFMLLSRAHPGDAIQRPARSALIKAWWGEVVIGIRVFGWRQPFRSNAVPDLLATATGRRGVVLVHGFICNRGLWNPWMERLRRSGTPFVAVNLEPVFGSIDEYAPLIDDAVRRITAATGCAPVLVAHSMGGLAVRAWLRNHRLADTPPVHSVVTIATPHGGTSLARFGFSSNTRQMRRGSSWLRSLEAAEAHSGYAAFTCYFGHCDNIVLPASSATLPGATNRHVPGIAHVHLAFYRPILDDVLSRTQS